MPQRALRTHAERGADDEFVVGVVGVEAVSGWVGRALLGRFVAGRRANLPPSQFRRSCCRRHRAPPQKKTGGVTHFCHGKHQSCSGSSDPLRRWQVSTYIHDHHDGPICTVMGTPLTPMKSSWRSAGSCTYPWYTSGYLTAKGNPPFLRGSSQGEREAAFFGGRK